MASASGQVWLRQAKSDKESAERMLVRDDSTTFCHAIAKYQQVVEKSIKGVIAGLKERGIVSVELSYRHDLYREITTLKRLPNDKGHKDIASLISAGLMRSTHKSDIHDLCGLAPARPEHDSLAPRNTEYPFQKRDGTWCVPADKDIFSIAEVERYERIARTIYAECNKIIVALQR